ncbi:hypothetical protein LTR10_022507 [Elasticomyces elasticus]|uniref:Uncharacterized protein n=1 Tax=Exophiala sideris TaxID=1016849 RepID=A0ABR0J741_9EURO|nr:hypothetical protein LTR10_022507 [Elasticomyces elasticus]KAK5029456.1 hypothetical protein LTS07_005918 [Exophiala sideris]KAK5036846.1 hypothetical protein LTR13_005226 [Exophiala sideris]KAK5058086.1 hypothetical protein LTR69_007083 [Exophiala sideris]KAK5182045.1 hypothetical protein LTR44_005646 [Eurotiomycetes sp. CCFEE 6388]
MAVPVVGPTFFNMMQPSMFNNQYSRGPLYQYGRERSQEERQVRSQRVQDAQLRRKGQQPSSPTYGPSSNDSYTRHASSGPPPYADTSISTTNEQAGQQSDHQLPTYDAAIGRQQENQAENVEPPLLSVEEEKARLRQIEKQKRQTRDDEAIAQTLSLDDPEEAEVQVEKGDKQAGRRKSKARKIGRWFADAASGYTAKQERW